MLSLEGSGSAELAACLGVGAGHHSATTPVGQVRLEIAAREHLIAVLGIWTDHKQLVQKSLDKIGGLLTFKVVYDLLVLRTQSLDHEVTLQTGRAEGMTTLRVDRVHQGLSTNSAKQVRIHSFTVIVHMSSMRIVKLATGVTQNCLPNTSTSTTTATQSTYTARRNSGLRMVGDGSY